jgi:hypothetical protein
MNARIIKKMAAEQLSLAQHNYEVLLEMCVKYKARRRQWGHEFATEPPTTTAHTWNKFEAGGIMHDVHKQRSGRPCAAMSPTTKVHKTMCM